MSETRWLLEQGDAVFTRNYRRPAMVLSHGEGCWLWDTDGKKYLDLYGGIAVSSLGHNHPDLVRTIAQQAGRLLHTSNLFYNDMGVRLAARLTTLTGMERMFVTNSGTESIECALKLVRKHGASHGRTELVATWSAFHGRTMGAVSLTGQPKYWEGFGAPIPGVSHVAFGDIEAMRKRLNDRTAAVFVEPVQGEGGVLPAPPGYLSALRELCDERGVLLVFDEIQTGVGRTGKFLGCDHDGVRPDVLCLAKGIAGGVPMGATLVREALADALPPGSHGTTFGGNPLASAAALTVLDVLERDHLVEKVAQRGAYLLRKLGDLSAEFPQLVATARGRGLLCGLVMKDGVDVRTIATHLRMSGVLVSQAGEQVIRFVPPLIIQEAEIDHGIGVLREVLRSYAATGGQS